MADTKISALTSASTPLDGTEVLPLVQSGTTKKVANNDLRPKQIQSNATSGVLQVAGPAAASTRVMTTPDANFTAARTDAAQSFSGLQTFGSGVSVTSGKVTSAYSAGGDFVALFQNTSSATPYGVWIKDAATPTAGYPLLYVSDSGGVTTYFRVDSSNGNTTLGTGNLVIGTAGKGIDFSADGNAAGMSSELLDDYEEGTWSPVLTDSVYNATMSVNTFGKYTKVGRLVTCTAYIETTSLGSVSAAIYIAGWPFSIGTSGGCCASYGANLSITAGTNVTLTRWGSTLMRFMSWDSTGGTSYMTSSIWTATGAIYISATYEV